MKIGRRSERGFALLMGLTVLVILTVLGLSVMSSMGEDLTVVRNMRESENALAIAEAGIAWGLERLNDNPYRFDDVKNYDDVLSDNQAQFNAIASNDDPICTGLNANNNQCTTWREITDRTNPEEFGEPTSSSRGTFRVIYGDNDDGDGSYTTDADQLILIRSLGIDVAGSQRLIEIAVTVGS